METEQIIVLLKIGGACIGFAFIMYAMYRNNLVKRSIGWDFVRAMGKVKLGMGGNDLVLRVKSLAGKEIYIETKQTPIIEYPVKEKGKNTDKYVIYDQRAVDSFNGIPILNVSPNDIRPIDRESGLLVNIPSEIIDKLAVDSAKTAEGEKMKDKQMKMLLWAIVGMGILFIIAISYINTTNMEVQAKLLQCTLDMGREAVINVGQ